MPAASEFRPPLCGFEAMLALMYAASRACEARERRDAEALAAWRQRADTAREWLRRAA